MIENWENGIRKVTLGEGTTLVSNFIVKGNTESSGILFCNLRESIYETDGNDVLIEITNMKGVMAYIKPIFDLLNTWNLDEEGKELVSYVLKNINNYLEENENK